jgi:hypothetical protein
MATSVGRMMMKRSEVDDEAFQEVWVVVVVVVVVSRGW